MSAQPAPKLSPDAAGGHWPTILAVPDEPEPEREVLCTDCLERPPRPGSDLCGICEMARYYERAKQWDDERSA